MSQNPPRFGPAARHMHNEWQSRREAQIDAAIAANRECYDFADDPDFILEVPPRPRWLGAVKTAGMCLAFVGLVVLLCIVVMLSPLVAIAAHLRARQTP